MDHSHPPQHLSSVITLPAFSNDPSPSPSSPFFPNLPPLFLTPSTFVGPMRGHVRPTWSERSEDNSDLSGGVGGVGLAGFDLSSPKPMLLQQPSLFCSSSFWDQPLHSSSFSSEIPSPLPSVPDFTLYNYGSSCLERKTMPDLFLSLPELLTKLADNPFPDSTTEPAFNLFPFTASATEGHQKSSSVKSPSRKDSVQKTQTKQGPKRRKNQQKQVICVPAPAANERASGEAVPSDSWAWRKYGQKPIKGSPYPRGYYRCSSCKGCSARKQVERSRTDPSMFIVTYTAEHSHPWPTQKSSIAGSARQKPSQKAADTTTIADEHEQEMEEENPFSSIVESDPNIASDHMAYPIPASSCSTMDDTASFSHCTIDGEDFFTELQELPDSSAFFDKPMFDDKSDEAGSPILLADPYNLFTW